MYACKQRRSLKSRRSFVAPGSGVSGGSPPCSRGERGRSDHSGSTGSLDPLTPHRRWRAAKPSLKGMNEVAQAGEAAVETHAGHCGAVEKHASRRLEPHFEQKLVWRAAGEASKNPRELKRADGDRRCHRRERMPFRISLFEHRTHRLHTLGIPAELRSAVNAIGIAGTIAQRAEQVGAPGVDGVGISGGEERGEAPPQEREPIGHAWRDAAGRQLAVARVVEFPGQPHRQTNIGSDIAAVRIAINGFRTLNEHASFAEETLFIAGAEA